MSGYRSASVTRACCVLCRGTEVLVSLEPVVFCVGVQTFRRCVYASETGLGYLTLVDGSRASRRTEYHHDRPRSGQLDLRTSQTLQ